MTKELIEKFENDVKKRSRFFRFLLALDQLGNVLLWNGSKMLRESMYMPMKQLGKLITR